MNIELTCLAASAVLCLALPLVYVAMYQKQVGFPVVSGNREDAPGPTGAAGRGLRAHRNLIENLVPFAIAVMLARAASVSNTMTIIGAEHFLAARLVHAITYFLGITGIHVGLLRRCRRHRSDLPPAALNDFRAVTRLAAS
jgi:uncharacterized MAPEG superfamily protein